MLAGPFSSLKPFTSSSSLALIVVVVVFTVFFFGAYSIFASTVRVTNMHTSAMSLTTRAALLAGVFAVAGVCLVAAIDNGVGFRPADIRGWSTWGSFRASPSDQVIRSSADFLAASPLKAAGYDLVMLDDGWQNCKSVSDDKDVPCLVPGDRDPNTGELVPDAAKFPNGMKAVVDYVHSKGLRMGIYTAVSARTCGGFAGSLRHEAVDAGTFARWGIDFVKHATCNHDCGIHDSCLQDSTLRMSQVCRYIHIYKIHT